MTLEEVLAKDNNSLTETERQLLVENKDQLTPEQRQQFGFEVVAKEDDLKDKKEPEVPEPAEKDRELEAVAASIKAGTHVVVAASQFKEMQDQIKASTEQLKEINHEKTKEFVNAHAARGAIKSDQIDTWVEKIEADASMKDVLQNLPSNERLAETQGSDRNSGDVTGAYAQIQEKAAELMKADSGLSQADAEAKVASSNPDLYKQHEQELREGKA